MERLKLFDVLKGIGILAVIAGHSAIPDMLHRFIYMWHMPLFFFVSGYFFKLKNNHDLLKKSLRTLFFPYLITSVFITIILVIMQDYRYLNYLSDIFTLRYYFIDHDHFNYCAAGPIWFLIALAWCRIIYNNLVKIINNKFILFCVTGFLSYVSILVGRGNYIPFDIAQGLSCLFFYHLGTVYKQMGGVELDIPQWCSVLSILGVVLGLCLPTIWVYALCYGCWPINVIAALSGILLLIKVALYIQNNEKLTSLFANLGRFSLLILCVHCVDLILEISFTIVSSFSLGHRLSRITMILVMFSYCLITSCVLSKIKIIRQFFISK